MKPEPTLSPEGVAALQDWIDKSLRIPPVYDSKGLCDAFFNLLKRDPNANAAAVVDIALQGVPPVQYAVMSYVQFAAENKQLNTLPASLMEYARRELAMKKSPDEPPNLASNGTVSRMITATLEKMYGGANASL
jgi:hypothetical protein